MGNVLEFYIKLKDMMSSGLAKVAQVAKSTGKQIVSSFRGVESSLDSAANKAKKVGDNISSAGKQAKEASFSFKNLARQLGIGLSVASLVAFTKNSLAQSAIAENQRISFKVLMGDKFEGDALYSQIRNFANTTPYRATNFMQSAKMLLGFGENKRNIMPDIKSLGNIAAAQDDPTQAIWGLSHAYGEVIAAGRLLGRNTLEMINWGFNPLKEISIMTGKSMGDLKREEERGAISAELVRKAFQHATSAGGKYNDMMKEQSQTLSGKWSTFMDLVQLKMISFGDRLAPLAKGLMSFATNLLHFGEKTQLQSFLDETDRLVGLRNELQLTNTTNQRRLDIFRDLKANYPSLVENIKNEHDAITKLLPDLDAYLDKRYLSAGVLKIKERFMDDLTAVENAKNDLQDTHGQAVVQAALLAGQYGIDTNGKSAGQLEGSVIGRLLSLIRSGKVHEIYGDVYKTQENKDLMSLESILTQNREAQKLYDTHIQGANKAQEAVAQFNKIMGIASPAAAGGKSGNPYADTDTSTTGGSDIMGGISRGGPRVININGGIKFADKFEMHVLSLREGDKEIKEHFQEMMLRVLNSGASVQQ